MVWWSSCGTEKALVRLEDGTLVETVVIPTESRTTGKQRCQDTVGQVGRATDVSTPAPLVCPAPGSVCKQPSGLCAGVQLLLDRHDGLQETPHHGRDPHAGEWLGVQSGWREGGEKGSWMA